MRIDGRRVVLLNMNWDILILRLFTLVAEEKNYQGLEDITPSSLEEACNKCRRRFWLPMVIHRNKLIDSGEETLPMGFIELHTVLKSKEGSIKIRLLEPEQQAAFDCLTSVIKQRKDWFAYAAFKKSKNYNLRYNADIKCIDAYEYVRKFDEEPLFDVILESAPQGEGEFLKKLRIFLNLGVSELLRSIKGLPRAILHKVPLGKAFRVKHTLESCGAKVIVQRANSHNYPGLPAPEPEYFTVIINSTGMNRKDIYDIIRTLTPLNAQDTINIINSPSALWLENIPHSKLQKEKALLEKHTSSITITPSKK